MFFSSSQFRPEHVNHPKATVAAQSAMSFNPDAHITAYHGNVKDTEFNVAFFEKYDLVLNALDNVDARRHVNRLCLAADTPLIESGTTGYIGQIMPIVKGQTECYECRPKRELPKCLFALRVNMCCFFNVCDTTFRQTLIFYLPFVSM